VLEFSGPESARSSRPLAGIVTNDHIDVRSAVVYERVRCVNGPARGAHWPFRAPSRIRA
jgi:hypothetical protein